MQIFCPTSSAASTRCVAYPGPPPPFTHRPLRVPLLRALYSLRLPIASLPPPLPRLAAQLTLWFPAASAAHTECQRRKELGATLLLPVTRGVRRAAAAACREDERRRSSEGAAAAVPQRRRSSGRSAPRAAAVKRAASPNAIAAGVLSPSRPHPLAARSTSAEATVPTSDRFPQAGYGAPAKLGAGSRAGSDAAAETFTFQEGLAFEDGQLSLPPSFDFVFFLDCLTGLLMHDHFQIVLKAVRLRPACSPCALPPPSQRAPSAPAASHRAPSLTYSLYFVSIRSPIAPSLAHSLARNIRSSPLSTICTASFTARSAPR